MSLSLLAAAGARAARSPIGLPRSRISSLGSQPRTPDHRPVGTVVRLAGGRDLGGRFDPPLQTSTAALKASIAALVAD
jgi:hypothetical protein